MPTRVLAVNKETVKIFASKADTFRALEKHKLPHPKWQIANNIDEALDSIYEFISTLGSVVVKPSIVVIFATVSDTDVNVTWPVV